MLWNATAHKFALLAALVLLMAPLITSSVSIGHTFNDSEADDTRPIVPETALALEETSTSYKPDAVADSYEPDDSFATATSIVDGDNQSHSISPVGDHDYVTFTLAVDTIVKIETSGNKTGYFNTYMILYDDSHNVVESDDDGGESVYSRIVGNLGSGTYYVRVNVLSDDYEIEEYFLLMNFFNLEADEFESDNTMVNATPVYNGELTEHSMYPESDMDMISFVLSESTAVYVEMDSFSTEDTEIGFVLVDDAAMLLGEAVANTWNGLPHLWIELDAGTYYLQIHMETTVTTLFHYSIRYSVVQIDSYEADNDIAHATPILDGHGQTHSIATFGDRDFMTFTIGSPGHAVLETSGSVTGNHDLWMELNDSEGNIIVSDDNGGYSLYPRIEIGLPAGTYYVMISYSVDLKIATEYVITLDMSAFQSDAWEPNGNTGDSKEIVIGESQRHNIYPAGDKDYLYFTLNEPLGVHVETKDTFEDDDDLYLKLFAEFEYKAFTSDNNSGSELNAVIECDLSPGTYYIEVSEAQNDEIVVGYTILLECYALTPDSWESDNDRSEANLISSGETQHHNIIPADDQDWGYFTLQEPKSVIVRTSGASITDDTLLTVYDGLLEITNDDWHGYHWSCIDRNLGSGTYYFYVRESGENSVISNYSITMEASEITGGWIKILSPTSYTTWIGGQEYEITWESANVPGNVHIDLYENGMHRRVISDSTENDGCYSWYVDEDIESSNYELLITDVSDPNVFDITWFLEIQNVDGDDSDDGGILPWNLSGMLVGLSVVAVPALRLRNNVQSKKPRR